MNRRAFILGAGAGLIAANAPAVFAGADVARHAEDVAFVLSQEQVFGIQVLQVPLGIVYASVEEMRRCGVLITIDSSDSWQV